MRLDIKVRLHEIEHILKRTMDYKIVLGVLQNALLLEHALSAELTRFETPPGLKRRFTRCLSPIHLSRL